MRLGTAIGHDTAGGNGAVTQSPEEFFVYLLTLLGSLYIGQGPGNALIGVFNALIDAYAIFGLQLILAGPDIDAGILEGNGGL